MKCPFKTGDVVVMISGFRQFRNLFKENKKYTVSSVDMVEGKDRGGWVSLKVRYAYGQFVNELELYETLSKERKYVVDNNIDETQIMRVVRD